MGNKNKYNNYFNGGQHQESEHAQKLETPENQVIGTEINKTEETIVESPSLNTVETTPISDIVPESIEIPVDQETIGYCQIVDDVSEDIEMPEGQIQDIEVQNEDSAFNIQNVRVNTRALNIRKEPKKEADIVTIAYEDELLMLCESTSIDGFYKVRTYTGFDGYCMEQFVDLI